MISKAVQQNLPIFREKDTITLDGKRYIPAGIGSESYLGYMTISPRRDSFAFISSYNGEKGMFKIGKLDNIDIYKHCKKNTDSILIEVVKNTYKMVGFGNFFTSGDEFVPKIKNGYLSFIANRITFLDWLKLLKKN